MTHRQRDFHGRIATDPAIMAGKPVVRGTRIPVEQVVQHLAENPDLADLFAAFPHVTREDVQACLAYAHEQLAGTQSPTTLFKDASQYGGGGSEPADFDLLAQEFESAMRELSARGGIHDVFDKMPDEDDEGQARRLPAQS